MNRIRKFSLAVTLAFAVLILPATVLPQKENIDELIRMLCGEGAAPLEKARELSSAYERVIEDLIPGLGSSGSGEVQRADETLKTICWQAGRPGAEAERLAASQALAAKLGEDVSAQARGYLVRQLGLIGDKEAVPALARLLRSPDKRLREKARRALQRIPADEATAALRKALPGAEGVFRIGLINSLGARRDAESVGLLLKDAGSNDDDLRTAAVEALARIGDARAIPAIRAAINRGSQRARSRARNALLILAENLAGKGGDKAAMEAYRRLLEAPVR